ncbi:acyl-CoA thioesterase [Psychromarinibacter halotolerans]|uniref:Acyl-CoA thioesterase n=1 Tax=Psychromarinibacter halotolerans TaxID=1775175 RepID=A0ABV7GQL3_9RHOB|nr:thioesterase family protein [Psychromarinibacter halotolerans]MDF0597143.1 thioesterase family protein [Psychromarinibacter halotolerans]
MFSNTTRRLIEWGDCDPAGIVFNPKFFVYFDHCTAQLYIAAGFSRSTMLEDFGAVGAPVVKTGAEFYMPSTFGEEVTITSTVTRVGTSSFDVTHRLEKDGVLRVEGKETRVWTLRDPDSGNLVSAPLPEPLAKVFRG